MKKDIKRRKSNLALDLSLHKNYKVSKQNKFGNCEDNKYDVGGKMAKVSSEVAKNAFSNGNSASTIAGLTSGTLNIVESAIANAEVDTSSATNAIEAVKKHQLDPSGLDALSASYNATPWAATDYNSSDFTKSGWEIAGNTFKSTLSGITTGASVGGPWGAIIGGLAGLGSGLIGWGMGEAKAEEAERQLEAEAKKANRAIELSAVNTRDSILQQQANNTLRNIAAEGGQLDTYKEGEEYDLSLAEIKKLTSQGYGVDLGYNINDEVDIDPSDIQTLRELSYEFDII